MEVEEYMEKRVMDQIKWYGKKSGSYQKRYKGLQIIKILAALLIAVLSLFVYRINNIEYFVAFLGAFIAFIESFIRIYDYKELWTKYRLTAEVLKREKWLYDTNTTPYKQVEDTYDLLVQRCEAIMQGENEQWKQIQSKKDN